MTPERESGDTVLETEALAREAAEAAGPVPAPRPEVLARVLEGLRHLPAVTRDAHTEGEADGDVGPDGDRVLPLPRRHT